MRRCAAYQMPEASKLQCGFFAQNCLVCPSAFQQLLPDVRINDGQVNVRLSSNALSSLIRFCKEVQS